jgi:hypothetical protein
MNQIIGPLEGRIDISLSHLDLLEKIYKKIKFSIKRKRKIMFSDIINFITRENYNGKLYNEILLWCNYNIKQGKDFVVILEPLY